MQGQTNEHRYRREIKTRRKLPRFYKLLDKGIQNTSPEQQFEYTLSEPQGTVQFFSLSTNDKSYYKVNDSK